MKLFVKYKNGSVEIVNVSELSYHKKNPCLKCRKGGGCYGHGCFMPEDGRFSYFSVLWCFYSNPRYSRSSSDRSFLKKSKDLWLTWTAY